jgi:hypothetical protein
VEFNTINEVGYDDEPPLPSPKVFPEIRDSSIDEEIEYEKLMNAANNVKTPDINLDIPEEEPPVEDNEEDEDMILDEEITRFDVNDQDEEDEILPPDDKNNLYEDFDDLTEFTCENAFYEFQYEILESIQERLPNVNPKKKLTDICINMHVADSKDIKTIYERHFQFIKNGMLSLIDFSFDGLNNNLNNLSIGRSTFFFLTTTINLIEVTTSRPHINSIKKILELLSSRILATGISFLIIGISFIFIILFFYIYNINKFCKQFYLLRKVFNICERHEQ